MKRIVVIADTHCGHWSGLCPPGWQYKTGPGTPPLRVKRAKQQREHWLRYATLCAQLQPVYDVFMLGDMIDGRGEKSGGTELVTTDRIEQCDMAVRCARELAPTNGYVAVYGTPYHTGQLEDFEDIIAKELGAEIGGQLFPEVEGVVFDLKHKVGGSSIPHGRHTAVSRELLWNQIWSDRADGQPLAKVLLRAHVHYHGFCGDGTRLAMTVPALQGWTTFGGRQVSGTVDWGPTWFDVEDGELIRWNAELVRFRSAASGVLKR